MDFNPKFFPENIRLCRILNIYLILLLLTLFYNSRKINFALFANQVFPMIRSGFYRHSHPTLIKKPQLQAFKMDAFHRSLAYKRAIRVFSLLKFKTNTS